MPTSTVLTGIDLPADARGGSMVLLHDVYHDWQGATAVTLDAASEGWEPPFPAWQTLSLSRSHDRVKYNGALRSALRAADFGVPQVLHCQHLAFSMSEALLDCYPTARALALCHGTDVIEAENSSERAAEMRAILSRVDSVVFPTPQLRERVERIIPGGLNTVESHLIPWGVPIERLRQALLAQPTRRSEAAGPSVMYAGRLDVEKGFEVFAEALDYIPRGWEVKVAAPPEAARAKLSELGIAHPVALLGWLSREELWRAFADSTVVVIPSTTLEAFGLTAVEAMLCRVPVVYADVVGLRQVIGPYGKAFTPRNPRSLSSAIIDVVRWQMDSSFPLEAAVRRAEVFDVKQTQLKLKILTARLAGFRDERLRRLRGRL